ncbi:hypothetical protein PDQ07_15150 [Bacillus cereus]|nr:hypothetical protein [Bacillus cereus]
MNEMQQKAVEQLLEANAKRIPELEAQLGEFRSESASLKCVEEIEGYYNRMEKAHGNYFFKPYNDYYYENLEPAPVAFFNGMDFNRGFSKITEEQAQQAEMTLPEEKEFNTFLVKWSEKLKPLLYEIYAANSPILRFEGLEGLYNEIKVVILENWLPNRRGLYSLMKPKGQYIGPPRHVMAGVGMPHHTQRYCDYMALYNCVNEMEDKIEKTILFLRTVHAQLPFAEITKRVPNISITNTNKDDSVQIGSDNSFEKEAILGNGNTIEKGEK